MILDNALCSCLSENIVDIVSRYPIINEIRIRTGRPLCVTSGNTNIVTGYITTKDEVEQCIKKLCKNSVHTYTEAIKNGYIPFENGYRIGVCGTAVTDKGAIMSVSKINSLNIRIPYTKTDIPLDVLHTIPPSKSGLIYSPANYGKTTLLRSFIKHYSTPPYNKRVAVIDSKNELYSPYIHSEAAADFFSSYPKYYAIDLAIKNMSPEIIICDEIGILDDVSPFVESKSCGISLLCSAHASKLDELLKRPNIRKLHESAVFDTYIGVSISNGERNYTITKKEDVRL